MKVRNTRDSAVVSRLSGTLYLAASAIAMIAATPALAQEASAPVPGSADQSTPDQSTTTTAPAQQPGQVPAPNQPSDDQPAADDIVVTGIRRGIKDSIDLKKNETSIVEAISAEDIGKLPDVSIAESIARLPGIAAQRVNGRAQVISIRGLAPDFTTTLLNGRQQASSGDNRAVEFDQYPSELLSSVVIYKTPDAQIAGFGLSGTADLRTVRPLEFGKRAFAVNLRGEKTEGARLNQDLRNWGGRASVSYIDQFADGTLGVAFGYAHLDSPSQTKHYKAYGYEAFGDQTDANGNPINVVQPDSADGSLLLNGQEALLTSRLNKRDAFIGIIEWQPSENVHSTLDAYYSKFNQTEITRGVQWFSNPFSGANIGTTAVSDNTVFTNVTAEDRDGSKFGVSGTQNNVAPIIRNDYNTRQDNLVSIGWNNEFRLDDRTKFFTDLSYSRNHRTEQIAETYAGYGLGVGGVTPANGTIGRTFDNIGFTVPADNFATYDPGFDYADASKISLGDRAPWGGWGHDGAIRFPEVTESVYALDLRLNHDLDGFFDSIDGGVNYTHRAKDKFVDDNDLFLKNGRQQTLVDPSDLVTPTDLGFVGFGKVLSVDLRSALDKYYAVSPIRDSNFFDKNWGITEDVITWHGKLNINSGRLKGNIGVQIIDQTQRSNGVIINGANPINRTDGTSYTDILPSLNLIYDFGGGFRLRLAASKTTARPRMDDLRANVSPSFNGNICSNSSGNGNGQSGCEAGAIVNPWSASGGNPRLKPWRADALDVSFEWYVNPTTYFAIAGFYKKLNTYIYQQTSLFDFTGIPIPTGPVPPSNAVISPIGQITLPANGKGGNLKGLEFSGSFNFGTVTNILDGLGVLGSLSLTESNLNPTSNPDPTQAVRIPGLSGTIYNVTAFYERGGFQARVSQRYRSAFKGETVQLFAVRGFTEILADKQVDAQIGYTIPGGALEGLGVLLQVNNLTDSPYRTRLGTDGGGTKTADGASLLETYEKYGRQYLLGFNYRF